MKLELILWDDIFAYEIRELVTLFVSPANLILKTDPSVHDKQPITVPGIMVVPENKTDGVQFRVHMKTAEGEMNQQFTVPADWRNNLLLKKETKRLLKSALFRFMQHIYPANLPWGMLTGVRPVKLAHQLLLEHPEPEEIRKILQERYGVSRGKAALLTDIALTQVPMLNDIRRSGVSMYIGIPLCPSKCSYCSFISQPVKSNSDPLIEHYLQSLLIELNAALTYLQQNQLEIDTLYIGGGTPSILNAEQINRLFTVLAEKWPIQQIREITFEAGRPDTLDEEKLKVLRSYPVSRLSINPQTFHDSTLARINRNHTVRDFTDCWDKAVAAGFDNINLDLIIGLPGEGEQEVAQTLEQVERIRPDSLTVHALAMKRRADLRNDLTVSGLTDHEAHRIMNRIYDFAVKNQLKPYYLYRQKEMAGRLENVGFARDGKEGRYNILMMEEKQTIIGIGAGAVSKQYFSATDRIKRIPNVKNIHVYMERIAQTTAQYHQKWLDD